MIFTSYIDYHGAPILVWHGATAMRKDGTGYRSYTSDPIWWPLPSNENDACETLRRL
jgi:hypothetical protein